MREGQTFSRAQLLEREHSERQLCRDRKRVYHYDPAYQLEDQPRANCRGYLEYRYCLISKDAFGVKFVECLPDGKFPHGSKTKLQELKGLYQLPELVKQIDRRLDE